jgi:hypothetical protein
MKSPVEQVDEILEQNNRILDMNERLLKAILTRPQPMTVTRLEPVNVDELLGMKK